MKLRGSVFAFAAVLASALGAPAALALPCPPEAVVDAERAVLRQRPTGFSRSAGTLERGDRVEVLTCDGRWMQVRAAELSGWTLARRLEPAGPAPAATESSGEDGQPSVGERPAPLAAPAHEPVSAESLPNEAETAAPRPAEEPRSTPERRLTEPLPYLAQPAAPPRRVEVRLAGAPPVAAGKVSARALHLPVVDAAASESRGGSVRTGESIVLSRVLVLRSWPGWSAPTAGACTPGTRVRALDRTGGWRFVEDDSGRRGWVVEAALGARPRS